MKFNIGHFPIGTVCEVFVQGVHTTPKQITVMRVTRNSNINYILESSDYNEVLCKCFDAYNICHVTKIVKRGSGSPALDRSHATKRQKGWVVRQSAENYASLGLHKHKSQYATFEILDLLNYVANKFTTDDMIVDLSKLFQMIAARGIVERILIDETWHFTVSRVNKHKLNAAVKQVINKCLKKHSVARAEADAEYRKMCGEDWEADMEYEFERDENE